MPRVPLLNAPQVQAAGLPGLRPVQMRADTSVAEAIGGAGRVAAQMGDEVTKAIEKGRQEAEAVVEAEAMLALDMEAQKSLGELKKQRGLKASEAEGPTLDALGKARAKVAEGIASPTARQRFLARSATSLGGYRREAQGYTAREFDSARDATAKAREEQALAAAEAGNDETFNTGLQQAEADIRSLAPSPEAGEAKVGELRSKAFSARVDGLIAQGRVDDAASLAETQREVLGTRYAETKQRVDAARKDAALGEMRHTVGAAVDRVRAGGKRYVKEADLRNAIPMEGHDDDSKAALERSIRDSVRVEEERFDADKETHRGHVYRSELEGRPIPTATLAWLKEYDPAFLRGYKHEQEVRWRQRRTEREGTASEKAAARAEQTRTDTEFRNRYAALSREEQQRTTPEDFAKQFAAEKAEQGVAVAVSSLGLSYAAKDRETSRRVEEKGAAGDEDAFLNDFEKELRGVMKPPKGKGKVSEELVHERRGKAARKYREWREQNGGKLDPAGEAELKARLLRDEILDPGTRVGGDTIGFTIGEKRGLGVDKVDATAPSPSAASPKVAQPPPNPPGPGDSWVRIRVKASGATGWIARSKFDPTTQEQLP